MRERNSLKYEAINLTVVVKFSCHWTLLFQKKIGRWCTVSRLGWSFVKGWRRCTYYLHRKWHPWGVCQVNDCHTYFKPLTFHYLPEDVKAVGWYSWGKESLLGLYVELYLQGGYVAESWWEGFLDWKGPGFNYFSNCRIMTI